MVTQRAVLQQLMVESVAEATRVATLLDGPEPAVHDALESLEDEGFVRSEDGFWYVTSPGEERLTELCRERFSEPEFSQLRCLFDAFEDCDRQMKQLASEWQTGDRSFERTTDELSGIHHDMAALFEQCDESVTAAYAPYIESLEAALQLFTVGESEYFTGADVQSYHNIWFRLHDDLLRTLGEERSD